MVNVLFTLLLTGFVVDLLSWKNPSRLVFRIVLLTGRGILTVSDNVKGELYLNSPISLENSLSSSRISKLFSFDGLRRRGSGETPVFWGRKLPSSSELTCGGCSGDDEMMIIDSSRGRVRFRVGGVC